MSKTSDAEKFEERWNSHIDELEKLGMTMSLEQFEAAVAASYSSPECRMTMSLEQFEEGDYGEVKEHIEELKELVSKTAEELTE